MQAEGAPGPLGFPVSDEHESNGEKRQDFEGGSIIWNAHDGARIVGRRVVHYDCANDNSDLGHHVPRDRYWQEGFVSRGTSITEGWLLLGADENGNDHRARVGIYTGSGRTGALAEVEVFVEGYDGESFTFPSPVAVHPGQQLYVAVTGIGDLTAHDSRAGWFIGRLTGSG